MKDMTGSSFPPHGTHFRRLWEAAVKSMKCHLWCSLGALITTSEEICVFLSEKGACLNYKPLYALSNDPLDPSQLSPDLFCARWTTQPITIYWPDWLLSNVTGFPSGRHFNHYYNNFGSASHQITWRDSSNVNVGRDHPLIHKKTYCWRKTTLLLYTGPWLTSQMLIQDLMERYKWSLSQLLRERFEDPLQKFALYRLPILNSNLTMFRQRTNFVHNKTISGNNGSRAVYALHAPKPHPSLFSYA